MRMSRLGTKERSTLSGKSWMARASTAPFGASVQASGLVRAAGTSGESPKSYWFRLGSAGQWRLITNVVSHRTPHEVAFDWYTASSNSKS